MVAVALTVAYSVAQSDPAPTYVNPVIEPVAADPSLIRVENGDWYLFATQDRWDDGVEHYLPIFRSSDLVEWSFIGDAFRSTPAWKRTGFLWAPDVSRVGDAYVLYFSVSSWGDANPCIGVATAPAPDGPWTELGRPVFCSDDIGVENSIDPYHHVAADGSRQLIWGSFHGISIVELTADGTAPAGEPQRLADGRFEGAYLHERDDSFYLFLSSGSCCDGAQSSYMTWVGRAEQVTGPYLDDLGRDLRYGGGRVVLFRNDDWVGPGHNAVATDDAGVDWLVYHAIDPEHPRLRSNATRRPVLIDAIEWVDGWPLVDDDQGPTKRPLPAPTVR